MNTAVTPSMISQSRTTVRNNGADLASAGSAGDLDSWLSEFSSALEQSAMSREAGPDSPLALAEEKTGDPIQQEQDRSASYPGQDGSYPKTLEAPAEKSQQDALHSGSSRPANGEPSHALSVLSQSSAHAADGKVVVYGGQHITGLTRAALQSHALHESLPHEPGLASVAGKPLEISAEAIASGLAGTAPSLADGLSTAVAGQAAAGTAPGAGGVQSPAGQRLLALVRSGIASGDIDGASVRSLPGEARDTRWMIDSAAEVTRRKLSDSMDASDLSALLSQEAFNQRLSMAGGEELAFDAGTGLANGLNAGALTERPVEATADLSAWMSQPDLSAGGVDIQTNDPSGSVGATADMDWVALLEQQTQISRLRDADALRVDLQLQDSQRLALEAQLSDGILTLRLGARADGTQWIPAEQIEALKAALRESAADIRDVVVDQSADLGDGSSGQGGSGQAADSSGRGNGRSSSAGSGQQEPGSDVRSGGDRGRIPATADVPVGRGGISGQFGMMGAGISLRA